MTIRDIVNPATFHEDIIQQVETLIYRARAFHPTLIKMVILAVTGNDLINGFSDRFSDSYPTADIYGINEPNAPDDKIFIFVRDVTITTTDESGRLMTKKLNNVFMQTRSLYDVEGHDLTPDGYARPTEWLARSKTLDVFTVPIPKTVVINDQLTGVLTLYRGDE